MIDALLGDADRTGPARPWQAIVRHRAGGMLKRRMGHAIGDAEHLLYLEKYLVRCRKMMLSAIKTP